MQRGFNGRAWAGVALLAATVLLGGCCGPCIKGQYASDHLRPPATPRAEAAAAQPAVISVPKPGDVLVAGGINLADSALAQVEFYQASSGTFLTTGSLARPLAAPGAALVARNGTTALIAGGASGAVADATADFSGVAAAEIFNRTTGRFEATGSEPAALTYPTATTLLDGTVLFAGGFGAPNPVRTAEVYKPFSDTFSLTAGPMTVPRVGHTATLLPDGSVLIVGGLDNMNGNAVQTAEIYDPSTGLFRKTRGNLPFSLAGHTATLIACKCRINGQVLIAGGASSSRYSGTTYDSAHVATLLYQPTTESFVEGPPLNEARALHTATILPTGTVLLAGGVTGALGWTGGEVTAYATDEIRDDAEIFDPKALSFTCVGGNGTGLNPCKASMTSSRVAHTATLLTTGPNAGKVLLAGGEGAAAGSLARKTALDTAELYDPAAGVFSATGPMHVRRFMHAALLLP